ncbi:translation elongation factor Ts [Secundilactobacillus odoratitofui DSM 19909 = JCM 15043]|uniref:Elongation factor Ts n=1 Tax=Secundilactobacillus odoratitofui DSM 19909 = JCM 15043 TaxID=1423776 RepID=A0A0R1LZ22_9LACO|nr:translation elongation factor Ts [Secundilactobacillus odoratitofui]KRK98201.1 translation elongation factor Ts [Secundilactobacillus odoratitofui DSM 19909 = JCM 15043]
MASINAKLVKELRDKTSVGMMDAKKALVATDGDMEKAVDFLREKGIAKAEKKSGNVAANGLAHISVDGNTAAITEINSETDFVATNDRFKNLVNTITDLIATQKPADLDAALALKNDAGQTVNDLIIEQTQVTSEHTSLRRFAVVEKNDNEVFGAYLHNGGQIAALVVLEGTDESVAKNVAMHVAAVNPEFVSRDDIPAERLDHERDVLKKEALNEGKPENIVEKMVEGRLRKFLSEISLADQEFVMDSDQTVSQYVASKGGKLKSFVRYEVGEGIEVEVKNFEDEVNSQING